MTHWPKDHDLVEPKATRTAPENQVVAALGGDRWRQAVGLLPTMKKRPWARVRARRLWGKLLGTR